MFEILESGEAGNCLILEKSTTKFLIKQTNCNSLHNFVCVKKQNADESQMWQLENSTQIILPFDQETKFSPYNTEYGNIKDHQVSVQILANVKLKRALNFWLLWLAADLDLDSHYELISRTRA